MVDRKSKKLGFSLAEALVSMLVLSIFFMATSKIITTKPKKELQTNKHGYFECYMDGSNLKQKRADGSYTGEPTKVANNTCFFSPPNGIAFVLLYALNDTDGRRFYVSQEPMLDSDDDGSEDEITITKDDLLVFHKNFMEDAGKGNPRINELMNFFSSSYPSSSIYKLLQDSNNTYSGPALFIGW